MFIAVKMSEAKLTKVLRAPPEVLERICARMFPKSSCLYCRIPTKNKTKIENYLKILDKSRQINLIHEKKSSRIGLMCEFHKHPPKTRGDR